MWLLRSCLHVLLYENVKRLQQEQQVNNFTEKFNSLEPDFEYISWRQSAAVHNTEADTSLV
jgi:hypothetical protein